MDAPLKIGERVRIVDGTFVGKEGTIVETLKLSQYGVIRVELDIFGRPVPVELEPWQIQRISTDSN